MAAKYNIWFKMSKGDLKKHKNYKICFKKITNENGLDDYNGCQLEFETC